MIRVLRLFLILVGLIINQIPLQAQENRIPDGGFEDRENWFLSGSNLNSYQYFESVIWRGYPFTAFEITPGVSHGGNNALKVYYLPYGSGTPSFRTAFYPSIEEGKYRFTFWYQTDTDISNDTLFVEFGNGKVGESYTVLSTIDFIPQASASDDFVFQEIVFEPTQAVNDLRITIRLPFLSSSGRYIYFDDVQFLQEVSTPKAWGPSPFNRDTLETSTVNLFWQPGLNAVNHDLWFGDDIDNLQLIGSSLNSSFFTIDSLDSFIDYYWRVDERDEEGALTMGDVWQFRIAQIIPQYFRQLWQEQVSSFQHFTWGQIGPGNSGYSNYVRFHPRDDNTCFNSPDMFNTYRTTNLCNTWHTVRDWDGTGNDIDRIYDMAFSFQDEQKLMAVNRLGLWYSNDKGASWNPDSGNGWGSAKWGGELSAIAVNPLNDDIWFAGAGRFPRGQSFSIISEHTINTPHGHDNNSGKIFKTTNGGKSWEKITSGIVQNAQFCRIMVDPDNTQIVYAASNYGFYRSIDGGDNWDLYGDGFENNVIRDFTFYRDPVSGDMIFYALDDVQYVPEGSSVTSTGGVFKSTDRGETWTNISDGLRLNLNIFSSGDVSEWYYRVLARWFELPSSAAAKMKYPVLPTDILQEYSIIEVDPSNPDRIYIGQHVMNMAYSFPPAILWRSDDGGKSWISCARYGNQYTRDQDFWVTRNNPVHPNMKLGHQGDEAIKYMPNNYPHCGIRSLSVNNRGEIVIIHGHHTFLSRDLGETWNQVDEKETSPGSGHYVGTGDSNLPGKDIIIDPRTPNRYFFTSGEHGLFRMTGDGESIRRGAFAYDWMENAPQSFVSFAIHPHDTSILYGLVPRLTGAGYLYKSTDGGYTWTKGALAMPGIKDRGHQNSLIIDKDDPKLMYFCAPINDIINVGTADADLPKGIYKSSDGGETWNIKNNGLLEGYNVMDIEFDPFNNTVLYAAVMQNGTTDGGLYRTNDGAENWEAVTIPRQIRSVNYVHFDTITSKLYICAGTANCSPEEGGVWVSSDLGDSWKKIFFMPFVARIRTASYDSERLMVTNLPNNSINRLNPGIYLSVDGGENWMKINRGFGQPDRPFDIQFDLINPDVLWSSCFGSGWYKGNFKPGIMANAGEDIIAWENDTVVLDGSLSEGENLSYYWQSDDGLSLDNSHNQTLTFIAPEVDTDKVFKFTLFVSNDQGRDSVQTVVTVRNRSSLVAVHCLDAGSAEPLGEVEVVFSKKKMFSNSKGFAYFPEVDQGSYSMELKLDNYDFVELQDIIIDQDTLLEILINPMKYSITFRVTDATTLHSIDSAAITIDEHELLTDTSGTAEVMIKNGEYAFTVSRFGYYSIDSIIAVDENKNINLQLERNTTGNEIVSDWTGIEIFPNPANEMVMVTGLSPGSDLKMVDLVGRVIRRHITQEDYWQFDASTMHPGLYFLIINELNILKFIKK